MIERVGFFTTMFRLANLFRGASARAHSPHTSVAGLARLYESGDEDLKEQACANLGRRVLSGRVAGAGLAVLPAELVRDSLARIGLTIGEISASSIEEALCADSLCRVARETADIAVLDDLVRNPDLGVRMAAVANAVLPRERVIRIVSGLRKDDEVFDFDTWHTISGQDYASPDPADYKKPAYSVGLQSIAWKMIESRPTDERDEIVAEILSRNPEVLGGRA